MTDLKTIAATLAIMGSGTLVVAGCEKDQPATETPAGADAVGDAAEGSCGAEKAEGSCAAEGGCGAEGSCGAEGAADADADAEGGEEAAEGDEAGEGSCGA